MDEFFGPALAAHGARSRELLNEGLEATKVLFPAAAEYIETTRHYEMEYMIPLMSWLLDNEQITNVVDIGFGYGTFPWMCSLAGLNVVGVNKLIRTDGFPFRVELVNVLDAEAGLAADLPGGENTLYSCMEMVEHNDQNLFPGLSALFSRRPGWSFFTTGLAGTQGCPARTPWVDMPAWDGTNEGHLGHVSGWWLEDLELLTTELGYEIAFSDIIPTCVAEDKKARLIVMGKQEQ